MELMCCKECETKLKPIEDREWRVEGEKKFCFREGVQGSGL